jgi:Zn ribbon nucleic-acid-binding protein
MVRVIGFLYVYTHEHVCPMCKNERTIEERFFLRYEDKGNNGILGPGFESYEDCNLGTRGAVCKQCKVNFSLPLSLENNKKIFELLKLKKNKNLPREEISLGYFEEDIIN